MKTFKQYITEGIEYYHASQLPDLERLGINPKATPHVSRMPQGYVYLGSLDYVMNDYLDYAKKGKYYIYKVNTTGLKLDTKLAGDQARTTQFIEPGRVRLVNVVENEPSVHPREQEYLAWAKELGKE